MPDGANQTPGDQVWGGLRAVTHRNSMGRRRVERYPIYRHCWKCVSTSASYRAELTRNPIAALPAEWAAEFAQASRYVRRNHLPIRLSNEADADEFRFRFSSRDTLARIGPLPSWPTTTPGCRCPIRTDRSGVTSARFSTTSSGTIEVWPTSSCGATSASATSRPVLGFAWAVLMPMLIVMAGAIVRFAMAYVGGRHLGVPDLAGIAIKAVPWSFFVGSMGFATTSLVGQANLVTKIYFPREVLPLASTLAQAFDACIGIVALLIAFALLGVHYGLAALWVPALAAVRVLR